MLNFTAYNASARTAKVSQLNATLNTADFDSYTIDANGNTVYTRNLITLGNNVSFDTPNTTVTMTAGIGVGTLTSVDDISGAAAGSYKVTKNDSGYSVSYVVAGTTYAWNATAADSVWDTSATNWSTDGGSTNVAFTSGGNVLFGSGETLSKTVAIDSAVTAGTISVADDYTFNVGASGSLSATAVAVAGTKTATLNLASAMTLSANLGGAGTLKKTGTAALTYAGTISSGATLEIAEGGTISVGEGGAGTLTGANVFSGTLNNGGTLDISGGVTNVTGSQKLNGNVVIASGATLYSETTDAVTWSAPAASQVLKVLGTLHLDARWSMGSGKKIVLSGGTVTGTGGNNGNVTNVALDYYESGVIAVESGSVGSSVNADIAVRSGYGLTFETDADLAVSGDLRAYTSGAGAAFGGSMSITKTGAGTLTLSGSNTQSSTTISAGTLVAASASALGTGAVTVNGDGSILDINLSSGALTQGASQALTTTGAGKITVSAGTLALTGVVNLSNAIEVANGAGVTTTSGVVFALGGLTGTSNGDGSTTFTLFTLENGASLTWDSRLTAANINLEGTSVAVRGATATFDNAAGTVTVSGTAGNLVWNGASGSSTWNYTAANTNWKIGEVDTFFQRWDNVTFGADATGKTVTLENGADIRVGNMTVEGGAYILNAGAGNSATISGATLTVASGASLQLSSELSGAEASALRLGFDNISVAGKLTVCTNSTDAWSKLTFAESGSGNLHLHDIGGDANTTGLTISTMQMDAAGLLTANWGGRVAISALTGAGNLTIRKPIQSITYDIGSLASYTGTLSMEGSGQELTVLLTGNNTGFTGNVKVSTGILGVNNSNALGSGTLTLNGGTLRADANNLSFSNAVNVTSASIINTQANTLTLNGAVSGAGKPLTKQGTGTLVLGNNTLSLGELIVSAGAVEVKNSAETSGSGKTLTKATLANDTTLRQYSGKQPTVATTIGELALIGATATLETTNFQGYWKVNKLSIGEQTSATLNLKSSHTADRISIFEFGSEGAVDVGNFAGTLNVTSTSDGNYRSVSVVLSNGDIAKNAVVNFASATSTTANLSLGVNADRVTIAGLVSTLGDKAGVYSGKVGTETTGNGLPASDLTVRTLVINTAADGDYSFNGTILANLNLEKTGAGTQTLAGASAAFNGSVTISQGVLALADAAAIGTGNTVRIAGGQLEVGNGTTAVSLNAAAYTIVLSDAYSETSGTGVAAIVGTDETTSKSSVALKTDTKITIELADSVAVSLAAEAAQYQYKIFDVATIAVDSFSVDNFVLAEALQGTWQISDYTNGVLTLTIPEPSVFGLLAGLGALALAGTRRRRQKKA